ncbi:MAG: tagaturonate epimerase family protein [Kiritimatiellia bacterium]
MSSQVINTLGCGDRFGHQGKAQLAAYVEAARRGITVSPVWNKSHREHTTVHTKPASVRAEADAAVRALGWDQPYFVDADHISIANVDGFIDSSDFFTLDVANCIGKPSSAKDVDDFVSAMGGVTGEITLPGIDDPLLVSEDEIRTIAEKYLFAVQQAGRIYRHIAGQKKGEFKIEVSMDETDDPQTPVEMLFILAMIARESIPIDTIAPKFSGRFNKGVNYVGDIAQFGKEFELDIAALRFASKQFGLKGSLRLSVHSGSDKFAIYPIMNRILKKFNTGLHLKTAGTTWLEEVIGLAEAGGDGLAVAKKIYAEALNRYDELAAPYAAVIDIDLEQLPSADVVNSWSSEEYVKVLRHDLDCPEYNSSFRQLIHVAYKVAFELGDEYTHALEKHADIVGKNVTYNLLERHILPIFGPTEKS